MGTRRKRWFALLLVLLLGPMLLYGGMVSPLGMALIRSIVQSQVSRRIDGTLSIGRIRSNLFNRITVERIQLNTEGAATPIDTASARIVEVQCNLFRLVRGDLSDVEIAVEGPLLRIRVGETHTSPVRTDSAATPAETVRPSSVQMPILERVRISDGTLEYVDERQNLSITLENMELYETRPPDARWATGDLRIGEATVHAGAFRDTSVSLQASFEIAPDSLRIPDLRIQAAHTSLKGHGEITLAPQPVLHLAAQSETDLAAALKAFAPSRSDSVRPPPSTIRVEGTLSLNVTADGPLSAPVLTSDVHVQSLRTDWGRVDRLSGVLRRKGGHVEVSDLKASVADGGLVGGGTLDRGKDRWTYAFNAALDNVGLGQLADPFLPEGDIGGSLSGTLSLQGETNGLPSIASSLMGRLQLVSEELVISGQEIGSAELDVRYEAGAVEFSTEALGIKAEGTGRVHVGGIPSRTGAAPLTGHLSVDVEVSDFRPLSGLIGVELAGTGSMQGTVQGSLSSPSVHLGLQGDEVVVAEALLGHVSGDVDYAPDGPVRVQFSTHDGHTRIAGTLDIGRRQLGPIVLSVDSLDVPAGFPPLQEAQVEGWIEAEGTLTGSFDHPQLDGTLHLWGVRWRGEPFAGLEGRVDLRGPSLRWALASIPPASPFPRRGAEEQGSKGKGGPFSAGGRTRGTQSALSAYGRLHLTEPFPFEATVIAQDLDLTPLLNALDVGEEGHTGGLLSASMVAHGTVQDLRATEATLTLDTLSVTVNDRELHSLQGGKMYLAEGRVSTDSLNLGGDAGAVHIEGYVGLSGEQQFRVEVRDGHLAALFPRTIDGEILDGLLNGHLFITGSASSPQIYGEVQAVNFTFRPFRGDVVALQMDYTDGSLLLSGWWDQPRGGQIQTDLAIPVDLSFEPVPHERLRRPFLLSATAKAFDLRGLWAVFPKAVSDFGGMLSADLVFEGDPTDPLRAEGRLILEAVTLFANGGIWASLEPIRIALDGGTAVVQSFESVFAREWGPQPKEGTLRCAGRLSLISDSDLDIVARSADMGLIAGLFGLGDELGGWLDAEMAWTGPPDAPRLCVEAQADGARFDPLVFGPLKGAISYENGRLTIHQTTFSAGEGRISIQGGVPMDLRLRKEGPGGPVGDVEVTVISQDLDLAFLKPLSPDIRVLNGDVAVDLRLTGDRMAPQLEGKVSLTNGHLRFTGMESELSVEQMVLAADGETIRLSTTEGKAGKGSWGLRGSLDFGAWVSDFLAPSTPPSAIRHPPWEVELWARDARVHMPKMVDLTVQGDLTWSGEPTASVLSGEMKIRKGTVTKSLEIGALLPFAERIRRPPTEPVPLLRGLSLDLRLQTESTLKVENDLANVPLEIHLDVRGTVLRPTVTGNIWAEKGTTYYLDRTFDLDRFSLLFADPYRVDPEIDIAAHTEVIDDQGQVYSIELSLSGTAFQPVLELSGSPTDSDIPLSQPSIVSLLTLGTTTEQLLGDPTVRADQLLLSRTKELASRRLLGLTSREIEQLLNIDQVYIEADLFSPSTLADARIWVDKRIAKRLNVSYSTVIGHSGEEQIEVDYRLTDHLSVQTQADRKGNSGIDLTLKMRFP